MHRPYPRVARTRKFPVYLNKASDPWASREDKRKRNGPPRRAVSGVLQGGENWGAGTATRSQARIEPVRAGYRRLIGGLTGAQLAHDTGGRSQHLPPSVTSASGRRRWDSGSLKRLEIS